MNFGPQVVPDPTAMSRETLRILRPAGTAGFTAWVRVGWLASVQATFPAFKLPPQIAELWTKPDIISKDLTDVGFKDVVVTPLVFTTKIDVASFVDGLSATAPFLKPAGAKQKYEIYLKERADGEGLIEMEWEALIVTAKK